ncbi:hypothetical protein GCM10009759_17070 [Kitasatospora saccharophila]|uniref:Uncharacterized protein n=1 Tax=Kitasatospora saccharophila TaxID=407973 RepID=A0ABP5I3T6_9ACTN
MDSGAGARPAARPRTASGALPGTVSGAVGSGAVLMRCVLLLPGRVPGVRGRTTPAPADLFPPPVRPAIGPADRPAGRDPPGPR